MSANSLAQQHAPRPPRFALRIPVSVLSQEATVSGVTRNVSQQGAFLVLDDVQSLGAPERLVGRVLALSLEFPPPWDDVLCEAEIRWVDPGGVGVQFRGMAEADRAKLEAILATRKPLP